MNDNKNKVSSAIIVGLTLGSFFLMGFFIGMPVGMNKMSKIHDKNECIIKYSYKTFDEMPARCIKYFQVIE